MFICRRNLEGSCRRGDDPPVVDDTDTIARADSPLSLRLNDVGIPGTDQAPFRHESRNHIVRASGSRASDGSTYRGSQSKEPNDREVTDAATILEFLAWGKRKQVDFSSSLPSCPVDPIIAETLPPDDATWWPTPDDRTARDNTLMHVQMLLPDRRRIFQLVNYHLDSLLWYHCSFHGPTFLRQLDTFYEDSQGEVDDINVDSQWVALLFAVIAATMCCATTSTLRSWGFRSAEQATLSQQWLKATTKCLDAAGYMANFSILSCQAVATLTMSAHLLGFSNQQAVLLASVTRIAQSLGLHRLDESSDRTVEVESGRRLWSQLCTQDWFSITFSECYLISPLHTSSVQPLHCDDDTLEDVPMQMPTITSYSRYLHSISSLMPRLQDGVESSNTLYTKYEQVLKYDREVRELATRMRPTFLANTSIEPHWPGYVRWARSAAAISSSHKIIMVHRKFLNLSFTKSAFAFTRRTCIAASKTILKEFQRAVADDGPVLWIYHAFSVAAAITLCLEMLHSGPRSSGHHEHHQLVMATIKLLEQIETSKIASRGVWLLSKLMSTIPGVETSSQVRHASKRPPPTSDDPRSGSKRQKVAELLSIVHYWQDGSESASESGTIIEPALQDAPRYSSDTVSGLDEHTNLRPIYRGDGPDDFTASGFPSTDDIFSRLNAGLAGGTVDAFESLMSLTHNYGPMV
jgi:hypothetical protein